jgi:putative exporter of polyketide antibiotics
MIYSKSVDAELALCDHSSPGRFTALRGFAFLGLCFSFHLLAETCCRVGWVCTQGWSFGFCVDHAKMHFLCSHGCVFS